MLPGIEVEMMTVELGAIARPMVDRSGFRLGCAPSCDRRKAGHGQRDQYLKDTPIQ